MLRSLYKTDPRWPLWGDFDRQMDWVMNQAFRSPLIRADHIGPQVHVHEDEKGLHFVAEVPGLKAEDIELVATKDTLSLKGARKVTTPEAMKATRRERKDVTFDATYRFEKEIDPDQVTAKVENGLLTITAPPAPELQPKRITVKVS
jgi:HSP20 family protein